jgi:hypothetical protein
MSSKEGYVTVVAVRFRERRREKTLMTFRQGSSKLDLIWQTAAECADETDLFKSKKSRRGCSWEKQR